MKAADDVLVYQMDESQDNITRVDGDTGLSPRQTQEFKLDEHTKELVAKLKEEEEARQSDSRDQLGAKYEDEGLTKGADTRPLRVLPPQPAELPLEPLPLHPDTPAPSLPPLPPLPPFPGLTKKPTTPPPTTTSTFPPAPFKQERDMEEGSFRQESNIGEGSFVMSFSPSSEELALDACPPVDVLPPSSRDDLGQARTFTPNSLGEPVLFGGSSLAVASPTRHLRLRPRTSEVPLRFHSEIPVAEVAPTETTNITPYLFMGAMLFVGLICGALLLP